MRLTGWFKSSFRRLYNAFPVSAEEKAFRELMDVGKSQYNERVHQFKQQEHDYLMDYFYTHWQSLDLEQTFKGSQKTVGIRLESRLTSGTLDNKILKDRNTTGFIYRLNLPGMTNKTLYIPLSKVVSHLIEGTWSDKSGLFKQQYNRIRAR